MCNFNNNCNCNYRCNCNYSCCSYRDRYRHCPPVTPLPPLPPLPPVTNVNAIQVQLQNDSGGTVANNANVVFDTLLLNTTSNITYNSTTGVFTIARPGIYKVNWWVNTDGAEAATNIVFRAEIGANVIAASSPSPVVTLQLNGQGLFEVGIVPVNFALVNRTGNPVTYGTSLIQGDLILERL